MHCFPSHSCSVRAIGLVLSHTSVPPAQIHTHIDKQTIYITSKSISNVAISFQRIQTIKLQIASIKRATPTLKIPYHRHTNITNARSHAHLPNTHAHQLPLFQTHMNCTPEPSPFKERHKKSNNTLKSRKTRIFIGAETRIVTRHSSDDNLIYTASGLILLCATIPKAELRLGDLRGVSRGQIIMLEFFFCMLLKRGFQKFAHEMEGRWACQMIAGLLDVV